MRVTIPILLVTAVAAAPIHQSRAQQQPAAAQPATDRGQQPAAPPPAAKDIRPIGPPLALQVNQGTLLELPSAATTLFIANSEVADAQLAPQSPYMVFVNAKKAGSTALYATDQAGNILLHKFIDVTGSVTVIRGAKVDTGEAPSGPLVLQIPLQPGAPAAQR